MANKEPILCVDLCKSAAVMAYLKDNEPCIITQININNIRADDAETLMREIISTSQNKWQPNIQQMMLSVPNYYTFVEISKLRKAAEKCGIELLKTMTRAEALTVHFSYSNKRLETQVTTIINSPDSIELYTAEISDDIVESLFMKSFNAHTQLEFKNFHEYFGKSTTVCLCDTYRNQILYEQIENQCKTQLKNYEIIRAVK